MRWRPAENLGRICDFVRAQGADVVFLQEVGACVFACLCLYVWRSGGRSVGELVGALVDSFDEDDWIGPPDASCVWRRRMINAQVFDWHLGPVGKLCDLVFKGSGGSPVHTPEWTMEGMGFDGTHTVG